MRFTPFPAILGLLAAGLTACVGGRLRRQRVHHHLLAPLALLSWLVSCAGVAQEPADGVAANRESTGASRERINRVRILGGTRWLDSDEPLDQPPVFGIEYVREIVATGVGLTLGFQRASDSGTVMGVPVDIRMYELYAGFRKNLTHDNPWRPYVGAGITVVDTDKSVAGLQVDSDTTAGLYLQGGLVYDVTSFFSLGFDLRGVSGGGNYTQVAGVIGFSF